MGSAATAAPILILGASGTLGRAFARICAARNLAHHLLSRADVDIADAGSVERALAHYRPWAVVNACGYVRVDDAEHDAARCRRENTEGAAVLAAACARHDVHLTTFSSDLVFDGLNDSPYVESAPAAPLGEYGRSKHDAERAVLDAHPGALVVRTSAFFGPWDCHNFVHHALEAFERSAPFVAANDLTVSPTHVPDLVHACLDLAIDREAGIWHLANDGAVTWAELARRAAGIAGIDAASLVALPAAQCGFTAARPRQAALRSERGTLLPSLDDALRRYVALRQAERDERRALEVDAAGRQQAAEGETRQQVEVGT